MIKRFQSDNGTEFTNQYIVDFLNKNGIQHNLSCPHTPQQMRIAERRNRQIVEYGLALMQQSKVPSIFWVEAFSHSVFLINNLSSSSLDFQSPNECLNKFTIDFNILNFLAVFVMQALGVSPKTSQNLGPSFMFLQVSKKHKDFKCYHISSGKTYISRHVIFNKNCFPYKDNIPCNTNLGELMEYKDCFGQNKNTIISVLLCDKNSIIKPSQIFETKNCELLDNNDDSLFVTSQTVQSLPNYRTDCPVQAICEERSTSSSNIIGSQKNDVFQNPQESLESVPLLENGDDNSRDGVGKDLTALVVEHNHKMITRSMVRTHKPNPKYMLNTIKIPTIPKTIKSALKETKWVKAINYELDSLNENNT